MPTFTFKEHDFEIRGLTRGEIKGLKNLGYHFMGVDEPTLETGDDWMDGPLEIVLDENDLAWLDENCTPKESMVIWHEIYRETYGSRDEEKNSQSGSAGSTTQNG